MDSSEIQNIKSRFGVIGNSEALNRAIDIAKQVSATDLSVLITGESGVGKEKFPQIVHAYSHRKHGPYIAVNCGAIPEGTIDSELFGHEKGSFTGANSDRKGYFEVANGGTMFLDEVGELPLATQVRLLRVLEAGEFIKVGSSKTQKTDVRVVAATNLNIPQAIKDGKFREDLFYRLNTVPLYIPPLRDRKEDIPLLFRKFAMDFADKYSMPPIRLDDMARKKLMSYYWHGNVRQLKNITEQISVIEQKREITADVLDKYLVDGNMQVMPVLSKTEDGGRVFGNEREILYQVLFDMKKDMTELKKVVSELRRDRGEDTTTKYGIADNQISIETLLATDKMSIPEYQHKEKSKKYSDDFHDVELVQDVEDLEEKKDNEVKSLAEMEREMIFKSLEKHKGKRKAAADELQISERTLYRKIKDYKINIE